MSRPFPSRNAPSAAFVRINGKIRAREVRVIGTEGNQLGVFSLGDAINLARAKPGAGQTGKCRDKSSCVATGAGGVRENSWR